jgi:hypothetical protein
MRNSVSRCLANSRYDVLQMPTPLLKKANFVIFSIYMVHRKTRKLPCISIMTQITFYYLISAFLHQILYLYSKISGPCSQNGVYSYHFARKYANYMLIRYKSIYRSNINATLCRSVIHLHIPPSRTIGQFATISKGDNSK